MSESRDVDRGTHGEPYAVNRGTHVRVEIWHHDSTSYAARFYLPHFAETHDTYGVSVNDYAATVRDIMQRWMDGEAVTLPGDMYSAYLDRTMVSQLWVDIVERLEYIVTTERVERTTDG
jgi:hypothetical protein